MIRLLIGAAALAVLFLLAPGASAPAHAVDPRTLDRDLCRDVAKRVRGFDRGRYEKRWDLGEFIDRLASKPYDGPLINKPIWHMSDGERAEFVEIAETCRAIGHDVLPAARPLPDSWRAWIEAGLPKFIDRHAVAQDILARHAAVRAEVDALVAAPITAERLPELVALKKRLSNMAPKAYYGFLRDQSTRLTKAAGAAASALAAEIESRTLFSLEDLRRLKAETDPWLDYMRRGEFSGKSGWGPAHAHGGHYHDEARLDRTIKRLIREGGAYHAARLLGEGPLEDSLASDRHVQHLLARDWSEMARLDATYHKAFIDHLKKTATRRREVLNQDLCEAAVARSGAAGDTLDAAVAGTRERPEIDVWLTICYIGANGFDVAYSETGGWLGGDGFTLTATPALDSISFEQAEPFERLVLTFEADGTAGRNVYWATAAERDGQRTNLSLQQWQEMLHRLAYMRVGPARHLEE